MKATITPAQIDLLCQTLGEILRERLQNPNPLAERAAERVERTRALVAARLRGIEVPAEGIQFMVDDYLWHLADDIRRLS